MAFSPTPAPRRNASLSFLLDSSYEMYSDYSSLNNIVILSGSRWKPSFA